MSGIQTASLQRRNCWLLALFETCAHPRVFGLAPGIDFPRALVAGLRDRMAGAAPESMARVTLIVNTTRMARRVTELFSAGPAGFLPRIRLITDLDMLMPGVSLPPAVSPLRRRLELIKLVSLLLDKAPDLAPRASLYDLTDSLAALFDEMRGEGVDAKTIAALDVSDQSDHWRRAQQFIAIAQEYLGTATDAPDPEIRQRKLVEALAASWAETPAQDPVIIAGSTGSRGATLLLMEAVARLPQGALVLPGYDFDTPHSVFETGNDGLPPEDHPQFRFHKLIALLDQTSREVVTWHDTPPPSSKRNTLVSLSLRPAPVTDTWLTEGMRLTGIGEATEDITLLQAPTPRKEAQAIALRLREAAENGQKAAVITPDRMLTRQITAALDQWGILPDDSAGAPLHLSPPGRFLRHIAALFHRRLDAEALLTLLKHPLTHSGENRGAHALNTQRLELQIRRVGLPYPDPEGILELMRPGVPVPSDQDRRDAWGAWIGKTLCTLSREGERPLKDWVAEHIAISERLSRGESGTDAGEVWQKKAGQEALRAMTQLKDNADFGGSMSAKDYADLVGALLAEGEVRDRDAPHPDIMIWGTLEARVQGADLVILAGLNEGTWPEAPSPDPWLNRALRHKAGLLLPDRRIGLSAHDYQQAIGAQEVWLSRSIRSDDAETVASRWLNRLGNLLKGLKAQGGPKALDAMIHRGNVWLARTDAFEAAEPIEPARRPSPKPPASARPRALSVTEIKRLIRDPYAVYAKRVLRLKKLGALVQTPDALLRGTVAHDVVEQFVKDSLGDPALLSAAHMSEVARRVLHQTVPWPAARMLWQARIDRIAEDFVESEIRRQGIATPVAFEEQARGKLIWADIGFTLSGQADRIDMKDTGEVILYDYKSGTPPSEKEQAAFDKQLLIEAAMIEEGAFVAVGPSLVAAAAFLGLTAPLKDIAAPLDKEPPAEVLAKLRMLIDTYLDPHQGFTSRRMMQKDRFEGDYDLLARLGEWNDTDDAWPELLT